jgi:hypothetical protein
MGKNIIKNEHNQQDNNASNKNKTLTHTHNQKIIQPDLMRAEEEKPKQNEWQCIVFSVKLICLIRPRTVYLKRKHIFLGMIFEI